jgi:hypothetical protein
MNDGESDAMWRMYLKGSHGIAIQSTVGRLKLSFRNTGAHTVYMALVEYIDYDTFTPTNMSLSSDYMYKRRAFRHEEEVRLGTYNYDVRPEFVDGVGFIKPPEPSVTAADILLHPERKGVYVPANISALIERVVVYPFAPIWFSDLVTSLSVSIRRRPRVTARNLQERLKEQQRGILRGGGVRDRRLLPVPGKQLVQPPGGVVGDPA